MNKKYIILFLITTIIYSQKCQNNQIYPYHPTRQSIDKSVKSRTLDLIETINIEENENLILHDIQGLDINSSSSIITITDAINRTLNFYDYKTGKIIGYFEAGLDLSDSVSYSGKIPFNHNNNTYQFIKFSDNKKFRIKNEEIGLLLNRFFYPKFLNDSLVIVTALITNFKAAYDSSKMSDISTALIVYNFKNGTYKVTVLENREISFPFPEIFYFDDSSKHFILPCGRQGRLLIDRKIDSVTSISAYDKNGNFIKVLSFLPKIFDESYFSGDYKQIPDICYINRNYFLTYNFDLSVYDFHEKKRFSFKNLPFNNDSGFIYLKAVNGNIFEKTKNLPAPLKSDSGQVYLNKLREFMKQKMILTQKTNIKYNEIFPIQIIKTFSIDNQFICLFKVNDSSRINGYYLILQEYDINGQLLSQTNLFDYEKNNIKHITFDKINKYLLIFKKNTKGWILEKYKW